MITALFIATLSAGAFGATLHRALSPQPESEIALASAAYTSIPVELAIPSLDIDARVEKVGINTKGNISAPASFHTVGWYKYGVEPGEPGLALLDGHVNNGLGLDGVFANLDKVDIGSDIFVTDSTGQILRFRVAATTTIDYDSRLEDISSLGANRASELAIITCEGKWIKSERTYDARLVVLARLMK